MTRKTKPSPFSNPSSTLDPAEQRRFAALENEWWSDTGSLAALHDINPVRIQFIQAAVGVLKGKTVLDVGCGGGVLAEPLARLGAKVTGLDASPEAISVARQHAEDSDLTVHYDIGTIEALPPKALFDVVIASEVVEHVADVEVFFASLAQRVKPNGILIITTLNRTLKSWALGIVLAERVLHIAPQGLHDWKKFLKPSEVAAFLRPHGLAVGGVSGLRYNPLTRHASLAPQDVSVNYLLWARRGV